jgi:hypothetical protein
VRSHLRLPVVIRIAVMLAVAVGGAAGVTVVMPAFASPARQATVHATANPRAQQVAMIAPLARQGRLSAAAVGKAVSTCVRYAARAGWANNGYYGGDLVTAATICVAESGGDPNLIVCDDKNGNIISQGDYPKFKCPEPATVSYDRGLWQLNTKGAADVSNKCAFNPVCNAYHAYVASVLGIDFSPWSSYDNGTYAKINLDLVQAAVTPLTNGTVTSALLGECLQPSSSAVGAKMVIVNCGSGAGSQQWSVAGGKLRSGSRCASLASTRGTSGVVVLRCRRSKAQDWAVFGRDELRNAGDGKCLSDPNSSLSAGTQMTVTSCDDAKNRTWWVP